MQFEIQKSVLTALTPFTEGAGKFSHLFVIGEGDYLRLMAVSSTAAAFVQLKAGQGKEPLLLSLALEPGAEREQLVLPVRHLLPRLGGRDCKTVRIDQQAPPAVTLTAWVDDGSRIVLPMATEDFFDPTQLLAVVNAETLLSTTHLAVDPRLLAMVTTAGKRLGIDSPHHTVTAITQTTNGLTPGNLGVQIVNCDWFYCLVAPLSPSFLREDASLPPAWLFGDYTSIDLGDVDDAVKVSITQPRYVSSEQLAMDFDDSDPCDDPNPLLKVTTPEGEETELLLSDILRSADIEGYLAQLSDFHLRRAYVLADDLDDDPGNEGGLCIAVCIEQEAEARGILESIALPLTEEDGGEGEPEQEAEDDGSYHAGPYTRAECAECQAWEDGCTHEVCILEDANA